MKKLDSKQHKETPEEELKRLRKRVKQLEGKEVKNTNTINLFKGNFLLSRRSFCLLKGRIEGLMYRLKS